jgi:hypothetical protein
MDALEVGDRVLVDRDEYSSVFMFTHKTGEGESEFVRLSTASGRSITASPGHYIIVGGRGMVAAGDVRVGDELRLGASGAWTPVESAARVKSRGLFNPQTLIGTIVVDGIVASTYTTAVEPQLAHALLAPFRLAFRVFGASTAALEPGSPVPLGLMAAGGLRASAQRAC